MKRWCIIGCGAAFAYAVLRYWPSEWARAGAAISASLLLVLAWWLGVKQGKRANVSASQYGLTIALAFASGSLLSLFLLHAPAALDEVSEQVMEEFSSPQKRHTQQVAQQIRQGKPQAGNWLWNEQTIRPLPRRANLKPGNQPEVFLQLDDPSEAPKLMARRAYISAFALGSYADDSWSLTPADTANPPAYLQRPGTLLGYQIFHPSDPSGQTPLVALQGMREAQIAPLSYRGDGVLILPPSDGVIGYRYRASSQPLSVEDLDDSAIAAARTSVPAAWLQLPDDDTLVMGIRGLNAESVTAGTLKQQLIQIRECLQQECHYSLDIANPDNHDPLENFLFYEKSGHCELFATAGVMAARALGVPARIAYGWAGGSYYESSNLFVFRAREAHAWTEVLIADVGWVVLDCTPAASIGQSRSAPPGEKPVNDDDAIANHDQESTESHSLTLISAWLGAMVIGCGGLSLAFVWWSRRQLNATRRAATACANSAGYYLAFVRFCHQRQLVVSSHQTVRQLLQKLPRLPAFSAELLRYHYAIRYGKSTPDATVEKSLQHQIQQAAEGK